MTRHEVTVLTERRSGQSERHAELVQRLRDAQKHSVGAPAWSRFVNRPVGRHLAAFAYRSGLSPDQVTGLSALCSFAAIMLLALLEPSWLLGAGVALLLVLGYALDSADGQLARLQGSSSPAGEWLDHVVDSAKIVCLHAAVLLQLQRWDGLSSAWSLLPLAFLVVSSVSFFTMILNEQLRLRAGAGSARAGARPSALRALLALPTDYGVLCCAFLLLGAGPLFLGAYAFLLAGTAGHLALALPVWRREMLGLGSAR